MMWVLAFIVWAILCSVVTARCEQQAAGSGGVRAVLGGIVVWLWCCCCRSQCRSAVDGGRGLVHVDLELGEKVGSADSVIDSGTPM